MLRRERAREAEAIARSLVDEDVGVIHVDPVDHELVAEDLRARETDRRERRVHVRSGEHAHAVRIVDLHAAHPKPAKTDRLDALDVDAPCEAVREHAVDLTDEELAHDAEPQVNEKPEPERDDEHRSAEQSERDLSQDAFHQKASPRPSEIVIGTPGINSGTYSCGPLKTCAPGMR